jgi:hypothetical protein
MNFDVVYVSLTSENSKDGDPDLGSITYITSSSISSVRLSYLVSYQAIGATDRR